MKCCQEVRNTLLLTYLISFFGFGSLLEIADPQNDTRIYLQNGPTSDDVQIFCLDQVEDLVNNNKFDKNKNTTVFFLDYYSSQMSNTSDFVNGYYKSQKFNLLEIYYTPNKGVSMADVKEPDVEQLTPLLSNWLMELSENIDWQRINILAYGTGFELTAYVLNDLREKSNGELIPSRVTFLDPPKISREIIKDNIVAVFIDAIHTNTPVYGTSDSVADVDFFPNFGKEQPLCNDNSDENLCSHEFAWRYWTDTIEHPEGPYYCSIKVDFNNFDSDSEIPEVKMGIDTDWTARGNYYLFTNSNYPYALGGNC